MTAWWLSCERFTVAVETDEDKLIVDGPPIVHTFLGQPIGNLSRWMEKLGGFRYAKLG